MATQQAKHHQIYTVQLTGGVPVAGTIRRISPPGYFLQPMIHPGGGSLVFWGSREDETGFNIWRYDIAGDTLTKLTDDRAVTGHPFWTPDDRLVYFTTRGASDQTDWDMKRQFALDREPRHLGMMDSDGTKRRQLTDGPFADSRPCVSPDGRTIVFASNRNAQALNLWQLSMVTGQIAQLTKGQGPDYRPAFSPSGDRLAYFTTNQATARHDLAIMDWSEGTIRFPIQSEDHPWVHGPHWAADGKSIIVHASAKGRRCDLYQLDLDKQYGIMQGLNIPGVDHAGHGSMDRERNIMTFDSPMELE